MGRTRPLADFTAGQAWRKGWIWTWWKAGVLPSAGTADDLSRIRCCRKARGSSPRRIEGRDNSDWQRLHQLHGSQYVDCRRNARRNKLGWNPGLLHSNLGPGRALHVLPRHVAATDMDRRQVCVRPPNRRPLSFPDLKERPQPAREL
jgi:hypothetical protein